MSWKTEVIADNSGEWVSNGLRFASEIEAIAYGDDLQGRWTAVREYRAAEVDERATAIFVGRKVVYL